MLEAELYLLRTGQVTQYEGAPLQKITMAFAQIVEDECFVTLLCKALVYMRTDVACATCKQNQLLSPLQSSAWSFPV